jgi:hypothetical protein
MNLLLTLILMSLAIEQIAHYLTAARITEGLRLKVVEKTQDEMLIELVHCHECCTFWVSLSMVAVMRPMETWVMNGLIVFALLVPAQLLNLVRNLLKDLTAIPEGDVE